MEKFVEKFNIFDIFTTLIPGIVISSLFGFSLSFRYYDIWISLPSENIFYFLSFPISVVRFSKSWGQFSTKNFCTKFYMAEILEKFS